MVLLILGIIGFLMLALCYPVWKMLERENSRWSNMVMALMIIFGIVFVGIFAFID